MISYDIMVSSWTADPQNTRNPPRWSTLAGKEWVLGVILHTNPYYIVDVLVDLWNCMPILLSSIPVFPSGQSTQELRKRYRPSGASPLSSSSVSLVPAMSTLCTLWLSPAFFVDNYINLPGLRNFEILTTISDHSAMSRNYTTRDHAGPQFCQASVGSSGLPRTTHGLRGIYTLLSCCLLLGASCCLCQRCTQ